MIGTQSTSLAASLLLLLALVTGCSGASETPAEPDSPTSTSARPRPQRDRPVRVIDIDLDSCQKPTGADDRFRIIAHEKDAEQHIASLEQAMAKAIDRSAAAYGWAPEGPVCVHVFSNDNAFLQGLQQLGGFPPEESFNYREYVGTVGFDLSTGRDAIFMNTIFPISPNWFANLVTHEYFHIVQNHVLRAPIPTWYLEGMAEWEAVRLQGEPRPTSLGILLTDERQGRSYPLRALQTWDQWRQIERGGLAYTKAKVAVMHLERLAGPEAPIRILKESAVFEEKFSEVTGLTIDEFEAGLPTFLEERILEEYLTPSPAP